MTKKELVKQIAEFEKGLNNPKTPKAAKKTIQSKLEGLKKDLEKMEASAVVKEEKIAKEEKDGHKELLETIALYEKGMNNPNLTDGAKKLMQKKIDAAKEELEKQRAELEKEQEQAKKETAEIKDAVKEVEKKVTKKVAKKAAKVIPSKKGKKAVVPPVKEVAKAVPVRKETPIAIPKIKEKEREDNSKKRKDKISDILSSLEALINKNKKLSMYKGSGVNLEIDAKRSAKPVGYRFRGKHDYRVPTPEEIVRGKKRGTVYFENRPERSDRFPKGYRGKIKLEEGGEVHHNEHLDGERTAKPQGWRWKDNAVHLGIIKEADLLKVPSFEMRELYPELVYEEKRLSKSDKNPSTKYQSLGKGGKTKDSKESKAKKPATPHQQKMKDVIAHAKATRKEGEAWKMAVSRAWKEVG